MQKWIFIDLDATDTRKAHLQRAREDHSRFLEKVFEIEHKIISQHKNHADIIVTKTYDAKKIK